MNDEQPKMKIDGPPRKKTVTLKKAHKHGGVLRQPGEEIQVRPDQEERLKAHDVI